MESIVEPINYSQSSWINRIWRILATALGFTLFGLGGMLMSAFWFTFLRLTVKDRARCICLTQNSIRHSFRFFIRFMRALRVLDYRFDNLDRLQNDAGCLIVANHPSLLDYVFLASVLPRCDCIVKQSLLRNIFMRGVIKAAGYIPNVESEALLMDCSGRLQNGAMILIFPEGTRTTLGQVSQLQRGAANIALRCQADIRIIKIHCSQPMLTKQRHWYSIPPIKPLFHITVHDKIAVSQFVDKQAASPAIAARRLTQVLSQRLALDCTQQTHENNNEKI